MSDVRYLAIKGQRLYYGVTEAAQDDSICLYYEAPEFDNGGISSKDLELIGAVEIFAPDADSIEEKWINATDRPSVKLKYPELHPVNDVES